MSKQQLLSRSSQAACEAPSFDPSNIRSALNQAGQPLLAVLEAIQLVKPEWSYSKAHAHWHAFCAKLQLPPAPKMHIPKPKGLQNGKQPAPMLTASVPTLASLFMSLPNSCPNHFCKCAAALYFHYNFEPPTTFVYEPLVATPAPKAAQNECQTPVVEVPPASTRLQHTNQIWW